MGGLYVDNSKLLQRMNAGCNGNVAGEVGSITPCHNDSWVVIFNAHQQPVKTGQSSYNKTTYNQDIVLAFIDSNKRLAQNTTWLTTTPENEEDPVMARYGDFCDAATGQPCRNVSKGEPSFYLVAGWKQGTTSFLAYLGSDGTIQKGPYNVTNLTIEGVPQRVSWGSRDDTWRTMEDGSITWLEAPNENEPVLRVYHLLYDFSDDKSDMSDESKGSDKSDKSSKVSDMSDKSSKGSDKSDTSSKGSDEDSDNSSKKTDDSSKATSSIALVVLSTFFAVLFH